MGIDEMKYRRNMFVLIQFYETNQIFLISLEDGYS